MQFIAECKLLNLVFGIGQDAKELNKGLIRYHREILLYQLSSHLFEGREDKHWIVSGFHGEVLKPVMKGLGCGDGPRVVPCLKVYPSFGRGASSVQYVEVNLCFQRTS